MEFNLIPLLLNNNSQSVGLCQVTKPEASVRPKRLLPAGHRYFYDDDREQWARFIDWAITRKGIESWFVTFTFQNYVHPGRAEDICNRWLSRLNKALIDTESSRLKWVRATEWQHRGVIHFHLILLGCGLHSLSRKSWEVRWKSLGGGFCRIYNAELHSAPYLAKYLNKTRGGELQWGGAWQEGIPSSVDVTRCSPESVVQRLDSRRDANPSGVRRHEADQRHLATGL